MATKTIFTVGFQLPTKDIFQYKSFHSNASLLDADIVLFEPRLVYQTNYLTDAHRLLHPDKRTEFFTQKAIDSAKRSKIALVNTHELFEVVKYLKDTDDKDYAKQVRECFKNTSGEIVKLPLPEGK